MWLWGAGRVAVPPLGVNTTLSKHRAGPTFTMGEKWKEVVHEPDLNTNNPPVPSSIGNQVGAVHSPIGWLMLLSSPGVPPRTTKLPCVCSVSVCCLASVFCVAHAQLVSGFTTAPRAVFPRSSEKPIEPSFAPNPFSYTPVYSALHPTAPAARLTSIPVPEKVPPCRLPIVMRFR